MANAAIYCRVSTGRQEQEETIESQIDETEQRIRDDGHFLADECRYLDDGYTGEILARPALDLLRYDAKAKKFDILFVYDRGRLARKFSYQEIVLEELLDLEIKFVSLHDINAKTAEEQVMQSMQGVFAEYERVKIAERMRRGKMFKVKSGKLLGYCPKYGYDYVKNEKETDFAVNSEEAKVVQMIFDLIGNRCMSIRGVIKKLYELGIKPKKGKRDQWTTGPIVRMLRDETYVGRHYYNKNESVVVKNPKDPKAYRRVKRTGRKPKPKEEWVMYPVTPIIDEDLFNRVQEQLVLNAERSSRNTKNQYLLQGLISCTCESKRSGHITRGNKHYRCTERQHRFPLPRLCKEGSVNAELADGLVWNNIVQFISDPEKIKNHIERYVEAKKTNSKSRNIEGKTKIELEIGKIRETKKRYAIAYGAGEMDLELLRKLNLEADAKIKIEEDRIKELASENAGCSGESIKVELSQLALKIIPADLSFEQRREIVRKVITKIVASKQKLFVEGRLLLPQKAPLRSALYDCRIAGQSDR